MAVIGYMDKIRARFQEFKGGRGVDGIKVAYTYGPYMESNPGAIKWHHTEAGGFARHVWEVMTNMRKVILTFPAGVDYEDAMFAALIHDLDKIGRYKPSEPWQQQPKYGAKMFTYADDGVWWSEPVKTFKLCQDLGIVLSDDIMNAVTLHHGFMAADAVAGKVNANNFTPMATMLHFADMMSVINDKKKG